MARSHQAKYVENIRPDWASGGINHTMPRMSPDADEVLKVKTDGFGRLFLCDDQGNILVSWNPDSHESNHALGRYVAAFFDSVEA